MHLIAVSPLELVGNHFGGNEFSHKWSATPWVFDASGFWSSFWHYHRTPGSRSHRTLKPMNNQWNLETILLKCSQHHESSTQESPSDFHRWVSGCVAGDVHKIASQEADGASARAENPGSAGHLGGVSECGELLPAKQWVPHGTKHGISAPVASPVMEGRRTQMAGWILLVNDG